MQGLAGTRPLTAEDVDPAIRGLQELLIAKNVAAQIAEALCRSVQETLVGRTVGTFTTIRSTVAQVIGRDHRDDLNDRLCRKRWNVYLLQNVLSMS